MSDQARIWSLERLATALGLAGVAFLAATRLMMTWPDPFLFGYFPYSSAVIGFVIGWRVTGLWLGRGFGYGLSAGITGAALVLVVGFVCFSLYETFSRNASLSQIDPKVAMHRYWAMVRNWAGNMTDWGFWAVLFGGGAIVGVVAERFAPRRD
jgi:hypothetical protein